MEQCTLLVEGGSVLKGDLRVQGAKNSALFLLAAALLTDQPVILQNVPALPDIDILYQMVEELGVHVDWKPFEHRLRIEAKAIAHASVNAALAKKLRASVALACPLLYRCKRCRIPFPGGDAIGKRPLDEMMCGIEALGGEVHTEVGWYDVRVARDLQGTSIHLRYPSHTATMALMMLGAVARGTTIIYNAAQEPEVKDMQQLLCSMHAEVMGAGTSVITIEGCSSLGGGKVEVMPDRLQIGTYLLAALMTDGIVRMPVTYGEHLQAVIEWLQAAGAQMKQDDNGTVELSGQRPYRAVSFATAPYPGFPTDLQAPMMAFLTGCDGRSTMRENVFENRLLHVAEMQKIGVRATILSERDVMLTGPTTFQAGKVLQATPRLPMRLIYCEGIPIWWHDCVPLEQALHYRESNMIRRR